MKHSDDKLNQNSIFYVSAVISFIILAAIVFLFPIGMSEYRVTDSFAPFWYVITSTGAVYGASVIIIGLAVYLIYYFKKNSRKIINVFIFISIICSMLILTTILSQYYFKNYFRNTRPSQLYLIEKGLIDNNGLQFFEMSIAERNAFLKEKIKENNEKIVEIYPPVLDNWVEDSGFSFPSGHSQISFFLGTIVAFVIFKTSSKKNLFFIPLIWAILVAISRVVIGAHFPLDVTAGAFIGLLSALILISVKPIKNIFGQK